MAATTTSLKQWMQKNQVFDKDLLRLFPKYGVVDPDKDLCNLSEDKWNELQKLLLSEKRAELKDQASNLRFKKKIDKITKLWKEKHSQKKGKKSSTKKRKTSSPSSPVKKSKDKDKEKDKDKSKEKPKTPSTPSGIEDDEKTSEIEQLRVENKKIRRELSSRNSDYNRLVQEFNVYKKQKEEELKKLSTKYNAKSEDYENLLKQYKQINQRVNSKYHEQSAKDKEISSLKTDKSALLQDINEVMKGEQERYDQLLQKYNELKEMNNRNLKYKLRYKAQKGRDRDHKHKSKNYTVDLNPVDIQKINSMDLDVVDDVLDYVDDQHKEEEKKTDGPAGIPSIDEDLLRMEANRPKKYKPSKQKRARARQLSDIVTSKQRMKNRQQDDEQQSEQQKQKQKEND